MFPLDTDLTAKRAEQMIRPVFKVINGELVLTDESEPEERDFDE